MHGSEGGGTELNRSFLPLCAHAIASNQQGESPCQGVLASETKGNCVAARRGGEQLEVNDQSVTQVNSIRPAVVASLLAKGEAQVTLGPKRAATEMWSGMPGNEKAQKCAGTTEGGWRRNDRKVR